MTAKERYQKAHELNFSREYPAAHRDGHYTLPVYPKVNTSNGLQTFIINFINWHGYRATRINVSGRLIESPKREQSGNTFMVKKFMRSQTRKGSADISSTIKGTSCQWEVKVGRDRPSEDQLKEQAKERRAGGVYEFIKTPEEFLQHWDNLVT